MPEVNLDILDGVATVTLNRPNSYNALTISIFSSLLEMLPRVAEDPEVGVVVLTGAGRAFCAGGDVKSMAESPEVLSEDQAVAQLRAKVEISRLLHEMSKPTIAIVNGVAAGAGLSLALACDMRLAAESARFITAFANMGFSGDFGGSYFLPRLVGTAKARELYFCGEPVSAKEALALGLVNRLYPDSELQSSAAEYAKKIAHGPRIALGLIKQNLNFAETGRLSQLLDIESSHMIQTERTEDHREAVEAFIGKRPPVFQGR